MDKERLLNIIDNNKKYKIYIENIVGKFEERNSLNRYMEHTMFMHIREIGEQLNTKVIEIPLKYEDVGAVLVTVCGSKYMLLNTNQPKNKMVFAFYHDIYHALYDKSSPNSNRRIVSLINSEYQNDEEEIKANLFAATILMPDEKFRHMYETYTNIYKLSFEQTVYRLMQIFCAPLASIVIRFFELDILIEVNEEVEQMLKLTTSDIIDRFENLGLDTDVIKSTMVDQEKYLLLELEKEGDRLKKMNSLKDKKYDAVMMSIAEQLRDIKYNNKMEVKID